MNRTLSIWNDLRPYAVGFDNIFDHFSNTLEYTHSQNQSYPPYNINKIDNLNWQIEMALAGFNKNDIEVEYADSQLTIKSIFEKDGNDEGKCHVEPGNPRRADSLGARHRVAGDLVKRP